jgi:hypothetical protein
MVINLFVTRIMNAGWGYSMSSLGCWWLTGILHSISNILHVYGSRLVPGRFVLIIILEVRVISTPDWHANAKVFKLPVWKHSKCPHFEVGKNTRWSFVGSEVENDILFVDGSYTASYPYRKFKLRNDNRKSTPLLPSGNTIIWISLGLCSTSNLLFSEKNVVLCHWNPSR